MSSSLLPAQARRVLELARHDRDAARQAVQALTLEQQVALVCETPVGRRSEILDLLPAPEALVPALPEAELCFTAKAIGLSESGWLLEHASPEQLVACVDLDAWSGLAPDPTRLAGWLEALDDAGDETLVRAGRTLDGELLVLLLRSQAEVFLKPSDEGWSPPAGSHTLEGQFFLRARREGDDLAPLLHLLDALFREDYWLYFRLMQGAMWELDAELEEWALRWRTDRLQELGFPPWEEAMQIYGFLRPEQRSELPPGTALELGAWRLPVWIPELPAAPDARHAIFRAAAELGSEERRSFFFAFVALANKLAVADRLPLGDAESIPGAIEKAARIASRGLEHVADANGLTPTEVLRRVPVEHLFRVGASLDRGARPPVASTP
jgi:hypothetical protein